MSLFSVVLCNTCPVCPAVGVSVFHRSILKWFIYTCGFTDQWINAKCNDSITPLKDNPNPNTRVYMNTVNCFLSKRETVTLFEYPLSSNDLKHTTHAICLIVIISFLFDWRVQHDQWVFRNPALPHPMLHMRTLTILIPDFYYIFCPPPQ